MKNLRTIAERIFIGRNSGNLAERFQDHLILTVPLLIISAAGAGIIPLLGRTDGAASLAPAMFAMTAIAMFSALIVVAYVLLMTVLLVVLGLIVKDTKADNA